MKIYYVSSDGYNPKSVRFSVRNACEMAKKGRNIESYWS